MGWFDDLKSSVSSPEVGSTLAGVKSAAQTGLKGVSDMASTANGYVRDAKSAIGTVANGLSETRLAAAGLLGAVGLGSLMSSAKVPQIGANWMSAGAANQCVGGGAEDWRVKVSMNPSVSYWQSQLLAPLWNTGGVIFPVLPVITVTHTAKYSSQPLTHSNYAAHSYEGSEVAEITINGEFIVQNITDGQYLLAAIYFFRSGTKMFWGADKLAGTPPPMMYLDGFGSHYFPHVPCVLKSFSHTMPQDVDYIEVPNKGASGVTRLPTQSTIQISLQPIYSRAKVSGFSLDAFAKGEMISSTGGFL